MKINARRIIVTAHSGLGDTMLYIPALRMLKEMYPDAELVCLANSIALNLFAGLDFIDRTVHAFDRPEEQVEEILIRETNGYEDEKGVHPVADVVILTNRQKSVIKAALKSKTPVVLTFSYLPALYTPRLHYTPHFSRKKQHEVFCYQKLIRQLNPDLYDQAFERLNFNDVSLKVDPQVKESVLEALKARGWDQSRQPHVVMINPLAVSVTKRGINFTPEQWLTMSNELAALVPDVFFAASCPFDEDLDQSLLTSSNIAVLSSNNDIKALLALISISSLVITPVTGTSHVSENMCVDVFGLCAFFDALRWRADGLHQLSLKQKNPTLRPSFYSHMVLPENWKEDQQGWINRFRDECVTAIDQMKARKA